MIAPEIVPTGEADLIQQVVALTFAQLRMRYPGDEQVLRGVHAKDHGCVNAEFQVLSDLSERTPAGCTLRHGVFSTPGRTYQAMVRFSNASTSVDDDSPIDPRSNDSPKSRVHGSRGMAIKLLGVEGLPLSLQVGEERLSDKQYRTGQHPTMTHGGVSQDFLLINQPVFAFANVEDYAALSQILLDDEDKPGRFFGRAPLPPGTPPSPSSTPEQIRAFKTLTIVKRIQSIDGKVPFFQKPPVSPVDNHYFGASSFLFGPNQVMRFRVRNTEFLDKPENQSLVTTFYGSPNTADPNYLRTGLIARLRDPNKGPVVYTFEAQVRSISSITDPATEIENASLDWPDEKAYPFHPLATLTIPLQEFESPEQRKKCERLVFTPWHGLQDHQPLGGINRLRRAVYEASAMFRNLPKEPA